MGLNLNLHLHLEVRFRNLVNLNKNQMFGSQCSVRVRTNVTILKYMLYIILSFFLPLFLFFFTSSCHTVTEFSSLPQDSYNLPCQNPYGVINTHIFILNPHSGSISSLHCPFQLFLFGYMMRLEVGNYIMMHECRNIGHLVFGVGHLQGE